MTTRPKGKIESVTKRRQLRLRKGNSFWFGRAWGQKNGEQDGRNHRVENTANQKTKKKSGSYDNAQPAGKTQKKHGQRFVKTERALRKKRKTPLSI